MSESQLQFKLKEIKNILIEHAKRKTWTEDDDDFNPMDNSGGNFDDAYYGGCEDGKTELARDIIKIINK